MAYVQVEKIEDKHFNYLFLGAIYQDFSDIDEDGHYLEIDDSDAVMIDELDNTCGDVLSVEKFIRDKVKIKRSGYVKIVRAPTWEDEIPHG